MSKAAPLMLVGAFFCFLIATSLGDVCVDGDCGLDVVSDVYLPWTRDSMPEFAKTLVNTDAERSFGLFQPPTPLKQHVAIVDINSELLAAFESAMDIENELLSPEALSGAALPSSVQPFAHRYGGHQFGAWAGQLGDGRALSLGSLPTLANSQLDEISVSGSWEWQLKGSGKTEYSRKGDGRAVLRSSIREYLGSWAMYKLGVPTSLCVGIVTETSQNSVRRDPFYDGNFVNEQAAVTMRIAPSWLRFGSFQILQKEKNHKDMQLLLSYTIETHFPHLLEEGEKAEKILNFPKQQRAKDLVAQFFTEVVYKTADMIAHWKANAFCHGVMNTDNFSILGLTIDYGPFGFLDTYIPDQTCNLSDDTNRYKFETQENIGMWNLKHFGESFERYIPIATQVRCLGTYYDRFKDTFVAIMSRKLGFMNMDRQFDETLVTALNEIFVIGNADYHVFMRAMATHMTDTKNPPAQLLKLLNEQGGLLFRAWWRLLNKRREAAAITVVEQRREMIRNNPIYVLRNHIAEKAIQDAILGDYSSVATLRRILASPYRKDKELSPEEHNFYSSPPDPSLPPVKVSCSS